MRTTRLLFTFYKSFAALSWIITLFCVGITYQWGINPFTILFWLKITTMGISFYHIQSYKKNEFHYYKNLGLTPKHLWIPTLTFDFILFFSINDSNNKYEMTNTLEIDSVMLEFDMNRVLQNVYLKCETGKVTGLLGRNGTGKSCLMRILFGELIPNDKSIRLNGDSLLGTYRSTKDLRYLPQTSFIPNSLTVKRVFDDFNLDFSDLLTFFPDFEIFNKSKLGTLSAGERRIIETYIILVSDTKFCMLDEPFSQVMPVHIDKIKRLIVREKKHKGIIITDHMYKHIVDICDNLYVIKGGKTYLTSSVNDIETLGYARVDDDLKVGENLYKS